MSEIKYPYIGKSKLESVVLFFSKGTGFFLESGVDEEGNKKTHPDLNKTSGCWIEDNFKNITREYLTNTWGVVESEEHAEFIKKLAKANGISLFCSEGVLSGGKVRFFECENGPLTLWHDGDAEEHLKQITIPMPPKSEVEKESSESEFPQIGDEVVYNGETYIVKLPKDKDGHIVVDRNGSWCNPHVEDVEKPKTPEQELRDELIEYLNELGSSARYCFGGNELAADELLKTYNITKKHP